MREKIDQQRDVAAYLKDAESATNPREAARLMMLAARLQEQISELEEQERAGLTGDPGGNSQ